MPALTRVRRALERAIDALAIALFAIMFAVVLAQVAFRYGLDRPLVWSEELSRYLFIWICFLGWVIATRRRAHIVVSSLVDRLPRAARRALQLAVHALSLLFAVLLLRYGAAIALRNTDVDTITLHVSFAVVYAVVPLSALAMAGYAVAEIVHTLRGEGTEGESAAL